jgi:hypothetical protein
VIYVTRNPRDVIASFHNHWTILDGYTVRAHKYSLGILYLHCLKTVLTFKRNITDALE